MKPSTLPFLGLLWLPLTSSYCPPTGSVLPPPKVPSDGNFTDSLAESLEDFVQSSRSWNASTNSFSVKVTSKEETLAGFYYTACSLNKTGVGKVASSSIYRVVSVTRVFTVLALLLQTNLKLYDPASKYVPELAKIDHYKDITLRVLASQCGDVRREGGKSCSAPSPPYSNSGFIVPGFVLEKAASMEFKDIMYDKIFNPLDLSLATDFKLQDPTARLYTTPEDLAKFVRSILRHGFLSVPRTDLWFKPTSFLSTAQGAVRMPWKTYRISDLTPSPRPVDVHSQAGNGVQYAAYIVIIPEYNFRIMAHVAGPGIYAVRRVLPSLMVQEVVRYFENPTREQAHGKYTAQYTNDKGSLVLCFYQGPGINIKEYIGQGKSVPKAWAAISGNNDPNVDARVCLVGENERRRVLFEFITSERSLADIYKDCCVNWFSVDQFRCQGSPMDEIDFVTEDGVIKSLRGSGLRQGLPKIP
ncbi:hypothetical protein Neosp_006959 [[Neocosmospora] mangrovei]